MHLGTLLAKLRRENDALLALAALGDDSLFNEIVMVGGQFGETPAQYVAAAASRFASRASNEEWLQLVSSLERSSDVAITLLDHVVRWALRTDTPSAPELPNRVRIWSAIVITTRVMSAVLSWSRGRS